MSDRPLLLPFNGTAPTVDPTAWVAPGATLVGAVELEAQASVWYAAVLRADQERITVGRETNIQDGTVVHADPGFPATLGAQVSVGHRAVLHGCTIEDGVLIGMGAIVLNGATVGRGSLIAAGALILEGTDVPPGCLVAGVPGKVRRELTESEAQSLMLNAAVYCALAVDHAKAVTTWQPDNVDS